MPFTKPLWNQGNKAEVMSPAQVEQDAALLREVEELIPIDRVKVIVEAALVEPLKAAAGLPMFDEASLEPEMRAAVRQEFERTIATIQRPNFDELANLAREQVIRYWVKILWAALQRCPAGVVLGTELMPEFQAEDWKRDRDQREEDLLAYLPLNRAALQGITRLFMGAVEERLGEKALDLPRGMRVTLRPNQTVVAHMAKTPAVAVSADGDRADL